MHTEMYTPAYITTAAVYVYGCIPEGRSNSSPTGSLMV